MSTAQSTAGQFDRPRLGVNVDHVATLRQARGTRYPDPVTAAAIAELAGADQITIHLREDRRHIVDRDVDVLRQTIQTRLNLEMASTDEMVAIACRVVPHQVTLVPEKREERTTEGGLDAARQLERLRPHVAAMRDAGIEVSLFIEADQRQLDAALALGCPMVELHTGDYAEHSGAARHASVARIRAAAESGHRAGLVIAAGHGLHLKNLDPLLAIPEIVEYNIGHAIVAHAVFVGFERAVREMAEAIAAGVRAR